MQMGILPSKPFKISSRVPLNTGLEERVRGPCSSRVMWGSPAPRLLERAFLRIPPLRQAAEPTLVWGYHADWLLCVKRTARQTFRIPDLQLFPHYSLMTISPIGAMRLRIFTHPLPTTEVWCLPLVKDQASVSFRWPVEWGFEIPL